MLRWELLVICWLSALALELLFELLFALELLFIIHPHGAVEFLKMRCCWCALLVICWLSALALELLFELLFMELLFALELLFELLLMELLFIIRPGAAVYNSPWCS